jgi:hypothetical protein
MNLPLLLVGAAFAAVALMRPKNATGSDFSGSMDGVSPPPLASSGANNSPVGDFFDAIEKWHFTASAPSAPTLAVPPITAPGAMAPPTAVPPITAPGAVAPPTAASPATPVAVSSPIKTIQPVTRAPGWTARAV